MNLIKLIAPTVHHGDCIQIMRAMEPNSIDAIVTDPPYGLGFMGKAWDALPPGKEWAEECLRVLKPGGHILAFGGSRTWHRLAVAVEDAGFEIRESIFWHYGSGFPKSHNVSASLNGKRCGCPVPLNHDNISHEDVPSMQQSMATSEPLPVSAQPDMLEGMRGEDDQQVKNRQDYGQGYAPNNPLHRVSDASQDPASMGKAQQEHLLLAPVQRGGAGQGMGDTRAQGCRSEENIHPNDGGGQPRVEGRCDVQAIPGKLHRPEVRPLPEGMAHDGPEGRVHNGASLSHGKVGGSSITANGSGESHKPHHSGQPQGEPGTIPVERGSQAGGSWEICSGCGKPKIPDGLGTALKPATEPIVMGRKPFKGTVANNVMLHGTGALNIDASRIGTTVETWPKSRMYGGKSSVSMTSSSVTQAAQPTGPAPSGRWPANVILDESTAAELDQQSGITVSSKENIRSTNISSGLYGGGLGSREAGTLRIGHSDSGGASRFFYVAKAPKKERPNVDGIVHTTVKPLTLMRYLIKLVTPVGGTVLDTFGGSGTTAEAAMLEGYASIIIEREAEYLPLIQHRIDRVTA